MRRGLHRAAFVAPVLVAAALLGACSGDGDDDGSGGDGTTVPVVGYTTTTTVPAPTTTVPDITYTVQSGDSLYRIANTFCTIADAIVAANGWPEGLDHAIFPGDVIVVPGPGCPVVTEPPTTLPPNKYLALYLDERVITDPFDPNTPDYVSWGPVCYAAYWTAQSFAVQGGTREDLLEALAPLGTVPSDVMAAIDRWIVFSEIWYPVYVEVRGRIMTVQPMYPDSEAFYLTLFSDPEYIELLTAYDAVGDEDQFAAKFWVVDVCSARLRTTGSTP